MNSDETGLLVLTGDLLKELWNIYAENMIYYDWLQLNADHFTYILYNLYFCKPI